MPESSRARNHSYLHQDVSQLHVGEPGWQRLVKPCFQHDLGKERLEVAARYDAMRQRQETRKMLVLEHRLPLVCRPWLLAIRLQAYCLQVAVSLLVGRNLF